MAIRVIGALLVLVGISLATGPWWSSTLARSDYALVIALGVVFGGAGLFVALPEDRVPRLRTFAFAMWMGSFGLVCATLALAPFNLDADGSYTIAGIPNFVAQPIPWWARIVAGAFAVVLLGVAASGLWGLVRGVRRPP
jgi:hypothetical protein